jgi:streptomycin 6-kinase
LNSNLVIPATLAASCRHDPERTEWLHRLPGTVAHLAKLWSLKIRTPFDGEDVSCAWVAPVMRDDGTTAILKLGMPHFEGEHEIQGLRFWSGDPTVRLVEAEEESGAMLLERCEPGTSLRALTEADQDIVIAALLRRLWRAPSAGHSFRPLAAMTDYWAREAIDQSASWTDSGLVSEGLNLFKTLSAPQPADILLATDLHAGNVLRAQREPWLVIDPKPFVGDPAYDVTQHLFNCSDRLRSEPDRTIRRLADLLDLDHQRIRQWTFARAAVQSGTTPNNENWLELARTLTTQ